MNLVHWFLVGCFDQQIAAATQVPDLAHTREEDDPAAPAVGVRTMVSPPSPPEETAVAVITPVPAPAAPATLTEATLPPAVLMSEGTPLVPLVQFKSELFCSW